MSTLVSLARWLLRAMGRALFDGLRFGLHAARQIRSGAGERVGVARNALPSLYDRHPHARTAPRRPVGVRPVELDRIVGTARSPSQNTADFLPLPRLRGQNWRARWQRINRAVDRLSVLPPIELVQVGDEYFVVDGHNRVAAALRAGAVEIDADVVQLLIPGVRPSGGAILDSTALIGTESVRQAGAGRYSRTVEQRLPQDQVTREQLLAADEDRE
jgi:hypothetical protein